MGNPTPKYANVTATLALFVALGGTPYAARAAASKAVFPIPAGPSISRA